MRVSSRRVGAEHLGDARIGGAVVGDAQFPVRPGLRQHRVQCFGQPCRFRVVDGHQTPSAGGLEVRRGAREKSSRRAPFDGVEVRDPVGVDRCAFAAQPPPACCRWPAQALAIGSKRRGLSNVTPSVPNKRRGNTSLNARSRLLRRRPGWRRPRHSGSTATRCAACRAPLRACRLRSRTCRRVVRRGDGVSSGRSGRAAMQLALVGGDFAIHREHAAIAAFVRGVVACRCGRTPSRRGCCRGGDSRAALPAGRSSVPRARRAGSACCLRPCLPAAGSR